MHLQPIPARAGIKRAFFKWASKTPRWSFLEVYEPIVTKFDDSFRTPEYHKHSIVRSHMLYGLRIDENEILTMVNRAHPVPRNVLSVVRTGWNESFTDLHCEAGNFHLGIRQRYLRPGS